MSDLQRNSCTGLRAGSSVDNCSFICIVSEEWVV